MPFLTNLEITHAIKRVAESRKQQNLKDGEGHGTGRLVLVLKPTKTRVTCSWMAVQHREGKRLSRKIGAYPAMTLAEARNIYQRDYASLVQKKRSIKTAFDTRPGSVGDLFSGYVQYLKDNGKVSWFETEKGLAKIAETLGRKRLARDIEPEDILEVIRPIYLRGAKSMADHVRSYLRAAFSWGLRSEHDYRSAAPRRFHLKINPAESIPTEPKTVGTRWLTEQEFAALYRWLERPGRRVHRPYTLAIRLLMLTGQRVDEIARLHISQWDAEDKIIDWSVTKNKRPHSIPVPEMAANLIESLTPNSYGWFFPSLHDPTRPVRAETLYAFLFRHRQQGTIPTATNRDLRRTWKTLAGKAGLSKDIRDRLQNHSMQDVSSRHYDRWDYMPEKRAAMKLWNEFLTKLLPPPEAPVKLLPRAANDASARVSLFAVTRREG